MCGDIAELALTWSGNISGAMKVKGQGGIFSSVTTCQLCAVFPVMFGLL